MERNYCYEYHYDELTLILVSIEEKLEKLLEIEIDKKIRQLEKDTKKLIKKEGSLLKEDQKRDKVCDLGKKMLKKKK